jgi:hypothetical protein
MGTSLPVAQSKPVSFQLYTTEAIDEVEARSMNTVSTIIMPAKLIMRVDLLHFTKQNGKVSGENEGR